MNIAAQVCPLLHARRLKELGLWQESLLYYVQDEMAIKKNHVFIHLKQEPAPDVAFEEDADSYAAFTVAELGIALPGSVNGVYLIMENREDIKYTSYPTIKTTFGSTEAQARANMLIWLIDNKYITVKEVNERLLLQTC